MPTRRRCWARCCAQDAAGKTAVLAVLLGYVRNQGDGRTWIIDQLRRALTGAAQGGGDIEQVFDEQVVRSPAVRARHRPPSG